MALRKLKTGLARAEMVDADCGSEVREGSLVSVETLGEETLPRTYVPKDL